MPADEPLSPPQCLPQYLPDEGATLALGARLGGLLAAARDPERPAIMLHGAPGSGKTTLARGLVAALPGGGEAEVCSPSFTILNMYPTRPLVLHGDLYRCSSPGPSPDLPTDLEDALDPPPGADSPLVLLEWAEFLPARLLPPKRLDILLEECHAARRFSVTAHGEAAEAVRAALFATLPKA